MESTPSIILKPAKSWHSHFSAAFKLGLPLVGAQLAQMAINTTDVIMLGWLGTTDLAAGVLATQAFFVFFVFGAGFANAIMPLVAQAESQNDIKAVRRAVRMGLWISVLYGALTLPFLWYIELILLALGQDAHVSALASGYMHIAMWGIIPAILAHSLRAFLSAIENAQIVLWSSIIGTLINIVLNYAFIFGNFGAPALGIEGAALASLGTNFLILLMLLAYTLYGDAFKKYDLYVRLWRSDWEAFFVLLRLGLPIGITIIAEVGMFTIASIFMGWQGTVQLAAHGIVMQLAALAFMVPLGLSNVATIRIGHRAALADILDMRRAAFTMTALVLSFAACAALLFLLLPNFLIDLFLDHNNPQASSVAAYAVPLLFIVAVFQLVDCLQVTTTGLLRGLKDTKIPMILAIVSYWGVGIPTAYYLGLHTELAGRGVWIGLAVGLAVAAALMNFRFWHKARVSVQQTGISS